MEGLLLRCFFELFAGLLLHRRKRGELVGRIRTGRASHDGPGRLVGAWPVRVRRERETARRDRVFLRRWKLAYIECPKKTKFVYKILIPNSID